MDSHTVMKACSQGWQGSLAYVHIDKGFSVAGERVMAMQVGQRSRVHGSRHWVIPATAPRMATQQASYGEVHSFDGTMPPQGFNGVG